MYRIVGIEINAGHHTEIQLLKKDIAEFHIGLFTSTAFPIRDEVLEFSGALIAIHIITIEAVFTKFIVLYKDRTGSSDGQQAYQKNQK